MPCFYPKEMDFKWFSLRMVLNSVNVPGFTLTVFQITAAAVIATTAFARHRQFADGHPALVAIVTAVAAGLFIVPGNPAHFFESLILGYHVLSQVIKGKSRGCQVTGNSVGKSWPASPLGPSLTGFEKSILFGTDSFDLVNFQVNGSGNRSQQIVICKVNGLIA